MASTEAANKPWEYHLRKYLLLLTTLVATVTYAVGFNPPGGAWQDTGDGHLAGDPIIRDTHYHRYLVFFYCNATAFASSLVVIGLLLLLAVLQDGNDFKLTVVTLRVVMVADLLSLMGAYAAGTSIDTLNTIYFSLLVVAVFVVQLVLGRGGATKLHNQGQHSPHTVDPAVVPSLPDEAAGLDSDDHVLGERPRKVLMLLATFAISVTYVSGLSTPGGVWDGTQGGGHRAGDAVLKDYHPGRLMAFFVCNTTSFVASLLTILLLLDRKLQDTVSVLSCELYGSVVVTLAGIVAAYAAGSCRDAATTAYVVALVAAVLAGILLLVAAHASTIWERLARPYDALSRWLKALAARQRQPNNSREELDINETSLEKARSLVLLLATLATTVTYQAGLDPPGGLWQDNGDGHTAGDPILLTTNPRRYKAFYYTNSTALAASLVAIVLVQKQLAVKRHTLEAAMILDLFGLIGAYATGSCRDVSTSIYVVALAGAVLVYVVIHVVFFTLDNTEKMSERAVYEEERQVQKRRKRLLLFAILAATITYQAGLTPPGGFWLEDDDALGHSAGEPVLFYNYPRRYWAFFYSNSLSFMSSIAQIVLLVNPNLYGPAIRSYALSVCTAVGLFGLVGAYAAGSTQHLKTSIYLFVLAALILLLVVALLICHRKKEKKKKRTDDTSVGEGRNETRTDNSAGEETSADVERRPGDAKDDGKEAHDKSKYLMLLGILAASVTYQAGLDPPGGVWQSTGDGHTAGNPVLRDTRWLRYLTFFYSNSTSLVASVVVVVLLLRPGPAPKDRWLTAMNVTVVLDLLGLLVAHAAGSSREWETSGYVVALLLLVLAYGAVHAALSCCSGRNASQQHPEPTLQLPEIAAHHELQEVSSV